MATPPPEANRSLQAKPLSGTAHPGSNQTPPSTLKSCLKTPICWPSTNPAGSPPSPAPASWKTPSCAWCKSEPPTQTLSTGWAEPPPASSSSPGHRRRLLIYSQTGTHPTFKRNRKPVSSSARHNLDRRQPPICIHQNTMVSWSRYSAKYGTSTGSGPCPWPPILFRTVGIVVRQDCINAGTSPFVTQIVISALAVSRPGSYTHPRFVQIVFIVLSNAFRHSFRHSL